MAHRRDRRIFNRTRNHFNHNDFLCGLSIAQEQSSRQKQRKPEKSFSLDDWICHQITYYVSDDDNELLCEPHSHCRNCYRNGHLLAKKQFEESSSQKLIDGKLL